MIDTTSAYLNEANATNAISSNIDALKRKDFSQASDEELMDACKQFESYFVEMVMKEVTKNVPLTMGGESDPNSTLLDFYKDKTISSLAEQSTEQNSLGLAQQMYEQMKRSSNTVTMEEILQHQAELKEEKSQQTVPETSSDQ